MPCLLGGAFSVGQREHLPLQVGSTSGSVRASPCSARAGVCAGTHTCYMCVCVNEEQTALNPAKERERKAERVRACVPVSQL